METKIVPGLSHDDLIAIAMADIPPIRQRGDDGKPTGITAGELAEASGITRVSAKYRLTKLVDAGEFVAQTERNPNGTKPVSVYYKKEKE